uniref:Orotate phosphoribosyltransferase n=1 Tax=Desulfovibrio sp. U5L TaxID=596152 RepID=I2Q112_9BACT
MDNRSALRDALWQGGAVTLSPEPVTLKSGRRSHVYITLRHFVCEPANLTLLGDVFGTWLGERPVALGTVASLLSPVLAGAFAGRFGLPLVLFRPDASEKGLAGSVFGRADALPVVLVDDVLTSGGTAKAAAGALAASGAAAPSLFVFVDKRPAGLRTAFPLSVAAPLTLEELLRHGIESGRLGGEAVAWAEEELVFLAT